MEALGLNRAFWRGRRVFLTGHTGFKGAWMLVLLRELGAELHGFALAPPTQPNLFDSIGLSGACCDTRGDVRELSALESAIDAADPEIAFHMAAQSLVRESYSNPVETYATNVMGAVHLLEACRKRPTLRSIVVVTSDKCYENAGLTRGYREIDRLGGHDPYSSSKAAAELVVRSYRESVFAHGPGGLASARAGNVIGGGDFSRDRLVPDAMRAFMAGSPLQIRNPDAVRPWQHVLDPLCGYLLLAQSLFDEPDYAQAWNFGPTVEESVSVAEVVDRLAQLWGEGAQWRRDGGDHPRETAVLKLDSTKARAELGWRPRLTLAEALQQSCDWYRTLSRGGDVEALTRLQARRYLGLE